MTKLQVQGHMGKLVEVTYLTAFDVLSGDFDRNIQVGMITSYSENSIKFRVAGRHKTKRIEIEKIISIERPFCHENS